MGRPGIRQWDAEVIVVGAGPAGSAAAACLAGRGRDVLLLERARFPRDKPCGEFVNPAGVAILRELGIPDELPAHGHCALRGLLLRAARGEAVALEYPGEPPPRALSIRRVDLDAALARRAVDAGARLAESCPVDDLLWERERVVGVRCRVAAGHSTERRARLVIAADGVHSRLARRAGLAADGRDPRFALVAHYRGVGAAPELVEMHALGWGYCGFAPTARGEATVAMVVRAGELAKMRGRAAAYFAERLPAFREIHARVREAEPAGPPCVTGPVGARVRAAARPGLLLAGDAAGFFDPFTGRGITRALRAARLAADTADALLTGTPEGQARRAYAAGLQVIDAPWFVERIIRVFVDRPRLLEFAVRRFRESPELGSLLLGVAGDLLPPSTVVNAGYLARLFVPQVTREKAAVEPPSRFR